MCFTLNVNAFLFVQLKFHFKFHNSVILLLLLLFYFEFNIDLETMSNETVLNENLKRLIYIILSQQQKTIIMKDEFYRTLSSQMIHLFWTSQLFL